MPLSVAVIRCREKPRGGWGCVRALRCGEIKICFSDPDLLDEGEGVGHQGGTEVGEIEATSGPAERELHEAAAGV